MLDILRLGINFPNRTSNVLFKDSNALISSRHFGFAYSITLISGLCHLKIDNFPYMVVIYTKFDVRTTWTLFVQRGRCSYNVDVVRTTWTLFVQRGRCSYKVVVVRNPKLTLFCKVWSLFVQS